VSGEPGGGMTVKGIKASAHVSSAFLGLDLGVGNEVGGGGADSLFL